MIDWFAQSIGIIASVAVVSCYTQKIDNRLKLFIIIGNALFAWHFYLLSAFSGMLIAIINCFRVALSIKFHKSKYLMSIFMVIYIFVGFYIANDFIDWLPIISSLVGTFSMFMLSGIALRMMGFIGSSAWLTYSIIFFSIGGILTEVFAILFNLYTMLKLRKDKLQEEVIDI